MPQLPVCLSPLITELVRTGSACSPVRHLRPWRHLPKLVPHGSPMFLRQTLQQWHSSSTNPLAQSVGWEHWLASHGFRSQVDSVLQTCVNAMIITNRTQDGRTQLFDCMTPIKLVNYLRVESIIKSNMCWLLITRQLNDWMINRVIDDKVTNSSLQTIALPLKCQSGAKLTKQVNWQRLAAQPRATNSTSHRTLDVSLIT